MNKRPNKGFKSINSSKVICQGTENSKKYTWKIGRKVVRVY